MVYVITETQYNDYDSIDSVILLGYTHSKESAIEEVERLRGLKREFDYDWEKVESI